MTAPAWIRGILQDDYGVPVDGPLYFTGGEEEPGRPEKLKLDLPPNIKIDAIGPTQTLAQMLIDGEIDALYTARMPSSYGKVPHIKRMWEDYVPIERAYYEKTKIFPIMHTVVLRRDVYEANRWLATALYKAFVAIAEDHVRAAAHDRVAADDAALVVGRRREDARAHGRRLLALRLREEQARARHVHALLVRTGSLEAQARSRKNSSHPKRSKRSRSKRRYRHANAARQRTHHPRRRRNADGRR